MSKNGFVKNGELILVYKEINSEIFEHYLRHKLLPLLPPKSVVVLDNASTYSK
jgi:transposase